MRGSLGVFHCPFTFTYVGRLVDEKKFSGKTPSAGAGANVASGALLSFAVVRSGGSIFTR